ncbi:hypothetical protein F4V43_02275 [Paenibacillus spiritus]|uniref:Uncharacterized protein n=1 Tax=Paenibacillus spiritus TaxID=2496557 RepID=A0A5J5GI01_9BACL|nr:hypothetical protein [Paenibacillus spiritus]KAA9007332.1 hypothetical protein F4V43_02275 [Paenibacillus spiritus]
MKRLFKVNWSMPYAKYETYVFGDNYEEALLNFNEEIQKEVLAYDFECINEVHVNGVIVTKIIN